MSQVWLTGTLYATNASSVSFVSAFKRFFPCNFAREFINGLIVEQLFLLNLFRCCEFQARRNEYKRSYFEHAKTHFV